MNAMAFLSQKRYLPEIFSYQDLYFPYWILFHYIYNDFIKKIQMVSLQYSPISQYWGQCDDLVAFPQMLAYILMNGITFPFF